MQVVITGASRGIGKAIATAFAKEGNNLLLCATNTLLLKEVTYELLLAGAASVDSLAVDLSDKQEAVRFGDWCAAKGKIDVLINNAGIFLPGSIYKEPAESIQRMMDTNFYSAVYVTKSILPVMMDARSGHIFNVCSVAALKAYEGGGGYSISKFAMDGFSTNLRYEMKDFGIKVTTCYPGAVFTDSWSGFDNSNGRIMEANDIASMILAATKLSTQAVVEEITVRPMLGDL